MKPKILENLTNLAALRADLAAMALYRAKQALTQVEAEKANLSQKRQAAQPPLGDIDPIALHVAEKQDLHEIQERERLTLKAQALAKTLAPKQQAAARARGQRQLLDRMLVKSRKLQDQDFERRAELLRDAPNPLSRADDGEPQDL